MRNDDRKVMTALSRQREREREKERDRQRDTDRQIDDISKHLKPVK